MQSQNLMKTFLSTGLSLCQPKWQARQQEILRPCLKNIMFGDQHKKRNYHNLTQQVLLQQQQHHSHNKIVLEKQLRNNRIDIKKLFTFSVATNVSSNFHLKPINDREQNFSRTFSSSSLPEESPIKIRRCTPSRSVEFQCEETAYEFVNNLSDSERKVIVTAIERYQAGQLKDDLEVKLAATQWRTRFGRPSKLPALGTVDPTGSFCAFPEGWLKNKLAARVKDPEPRDLFKIFFVNAVPFVAFGFLDNFTMIVAGDYIELLFGRQFGLSTMAAAGLGNTISDMLGIGSAYYVERGCAILGLVPPSLTAAQFELKSARRAANWGRLIGITLGCLIGMCPLLFLEHPDTPSSQ